MRLAVAATVLFSLRLAAFVQSDRGTITGTVSVENLGLGRTFRFHERASVNIRIEFTDVFNRTQMNNPIVNNAEGTQTASGGFGFINTATTFSPPRQGSIVARFQF